MTIGDLANYLAQIEDQSGTVYIELPNSGPDDDLGAPDIVDLSIDSDGDLIVRLRP
jgi:hypothetical protein